MNIGFALPPSLVSPRTIEGRQAREVIKRCAREVGKAKMRPYGVVFGIGDAFHAQSSKNTNAAALRALLDCLIDLNVVYLKANPSTPGLYETSVYYRLMPTKYPWDTIPTLYNRGFGDCKSLVAARVAQLRQNGNSARPVFRFIENNWGTMFHILILHGNGTWECPSRILGMKTGQELPAYSIT